MSVAAHGNSCATGICTGVIGICTGVIGIVGIRIVGLNHGGRSGNGICRCVGIGGNDGEACDLRLLILTAADIENVGLDEVVARGHSDSAFSHKESLAMLVAENGVIGAACILSEGYINLGTNVEDDITGVGTAANAKILGAKLCNSIINVIISSRGRDISLVKADGIIESHRRGGILCRRNDRGVYLIGRLNILLLTSCICKDVRAHLGN